MKRSLYYRIRFSRLYESMETKKSYEQSALEAYHGLAWDAKAIIERGKQRWSDRISDEMQHQLKSLNLTTYQHCREFLRHNLHLSHVDLYTLLREIRAYRHQLGSFNQALDAMQKKYRITWRYQVPLLRVLRILAGKSQHMIKQLIDATHWTTDLPTKHSDTIHTTKEALIDAVHTPAEQTTLFPLDDVPPKSKKPITSKHPY